MPRHPVVHGHPTHAALSDLPAALVPGVFLAAAVAGVTHLDDHAPRARSAPSRDRPRDPPDVERRETFRPPRDSSTAGTEHRRVEPQLPASGVTLGEDGVARCWWAGADPLYRGYHDAEWGRPAADDVRLFEKLTLEGFQSGLSWLTILRKRENFRRAFAGFDIEAVAGFGTEDEARLLADAGIVRNRAKIAAAITNARRCADLAAEFGSLAAYAWGFEPDPAARPASLDWDTLRRLGPAPEAIAMSRDLHRRGWAFVGPTTVYSFMQAMGLVDDHLSGCDIRVECERERAAFPRPHRL
jgi:DNA-3-methyladenine glycosylase I